MATWLVILFWVLLFVFTGASLALAAVSWKAKTLWPIACSSATLGLALLTAALAAPSEIPALAALLTVLVIALAVIGGGPAATAVLKLATRDSVTDGKYGGILIEAEPREVLRGGLAIGLLERLAVVGSIVAGFPGALAVIVAVKGVGRFSELDAAEARERFIIGSFASLIWACASAGIAILALG